MRFWAYIIEKIRSLVDIHYQLQNNGSTLLYYLFDGYIFLDSDLDTL